MAQVSVAKIFADNMVLQRSGPIPVWGWASPGEKVSVLFNHQIKTSKADKAGKWTVKLDPEQAGGPYLLIIKGKNTIELKNVLVGDVWLCSGQSNMEWTVGQSMNAKEEIASTNNSNIRHIKISKEISSLPEKDLKKSQWKVCDSTTVGEFTGVGYFFAKNVYAETKVPIGLINASWGGSNIETWTSREAFESSDEFKEMIAGYPKINLDSITKLKVGAVRKRIESLQHGQINSKDTSRFKDTSWDDSNWPELNQPQIWEQQALGEIDGVVWLRKTITLTSNDLTSPAVLELSTIDDNDVTYLNGVKVGSTNQWDKVRKYKVPAGLLQEGKNVIAIRVTDTGGAGGMYGNDKNIKLTIGQVSFPLGGKWKYQVASIQFGTSMNSLPSLTFNAMIYPLIPFGVRGFLWYQGETNAGRAYQYRKAFPLLINDWRTKWANPNLPFYFVQLATFNTDGNSNEGCNWAELREAQSLTLQTPFTGMCVTTDIGNPRDIHPTNKQEVGKRLSAIALHDLYKKEIVCGGPTYKSMEVKGNEIIITFDNLGSGLTTPDKYGYIKGFEIAGKDQVFRYAKAAIRGNTMVVSNEEIENPVAVNFGWRGDASDNNLFNKEGFPAVPFRTHEWKTITKNEKYNIEKFK